jgi:hypothetical protein
MPYAKANPQTEYRERQARRAERSAGLATAYPELRSLTADLIYFHGEIFSGGHGFKYRVNLKNARTIFRFNCPSALCVRGDFDLSKELADAAARHETKVTGHMRCPGWRHKANGEIIRCECILHYKLSLAYTEDPA